MMLGFSGESYSNEEVDDMCLVAIAIQWILQTDTTMLMSKAELSGKSPWCRMLVATCRWRYRDVPSHEHCRRSQY